MSGQEPGAAPSIGPKLLASLATSNLFGLLMFLLLAASPSLFAREKLN